MPAVLVSLTAGFVVVSLRMANSLRKGRDFVYIYSSRRVDFSLPYYNLASPLAGEGRKSS